ncbi:hypothetical protein [Tsukamurella conjunctivitidis]|uniref:hypothetical protein n=1 Tax=Tsukamurella conjunctivitidis TaxID=2592068 RepID=UPI001E2CB70C|nr:hypothetical protein [Tsukamurella conjunctivitidis]
MDDRTALSARVAPDSSSMPKTADMITSSVICCPMSASATGSPRRPLVDPARGGRVDALVILDHRAPVELRQQ